MRFLNVLLATILFGAFPAHAGFQGINGVTSLGIFNKLTCSTGLTCTKTKDAFVMVSSPSITGAPLTLTAASSTAANLLLIANNNLTNGDAWEFQSTTSEGGLKILNNTSGSQVQKVLIDTSGNMTLAGGITVTGKSIQTGGVGSGTSPYTRFAAWVPSAVADATSTTPVATTLYMTQIHTAHNFTMTGIQVLNAGTVGTNKYIVALFDKSGNLLANSATAGVLTAGASAYQSVPFTAPFASTGPETFWLGLYVNGTTDRFYAIPALGSALGLAGTVTGQTFGTVATVTAPTTFTAGAGAVLATY